MSGLEEITITQCSNCNKTVYTWYFLNDRGKKIGWYDTGIPLYEGDINSDRTVFFNAENTFVATEKPPFDYKDVVGIECSECEYAYYSDSINDRCVYLAVIAIAKKAKAKKCYGVEIYD